MRFPGVTRLVAGISRKQDAERFPTDLEQRLNGFGLAFHPDKTRCIEFGRDAMANRRARGERRPETFGFLGFTHYCRTTRKGKFGLGRKPQTKRMSRTLKRIGQALRRRRHDNPEDVAIWLRSVIGGWLRFFAVAISFPFLATFAHRIKRLWFQQLRQPSQRAKAAELWLLLDRLVKEYLPPPRHALRGSREAPSAAAARHSNTAAMGRIQVQGGAG